MLSVAETRTAIQNLDGKTIAQIVYGGSGRPWVVIGGISTICEITGLAREDLTSYVGFVPFKHVYNTHVMHKWFLEPWLESRDHKPDEDFLNARNTKFKSKIRNLPIKRILVSDLAYSLRATDDVVEQYMSETFNIPQVEQVFRSGLSTKGYRIRGKQNQSRGVI